MSCRFTRIVPTLALVIGALVGGSAYATPLLTGASPDGGWDLTARARNGRTGFELAFQDPAVVNRNVPGAPAWSYGNAHHFELGYTGVTGQLSLGVDFNRDGNILAGETLTHTFAAFAGYGFETVGLFLQGNATGNVRVENLTLNGVGFGHFGFTANSIVQQNFVNSSGGFRDVLLSGDLIFSANGGSDERPRMWLRLGHEVSLLMLPSADAEAAPEPSSLALLGLGLVGLAGFRRRASRH